MYLLKIKTSINDLMTISKNKSIVINNCEYMYQIYQIDSNIIYENNNEYQIVYLKIFNLEEDYLINNFSLNVKIPKDSKVLIDYLK